MKTPDELKPLIWASGTRKALKAFPREVIQEVGFALHLAQSGTKSLAAKP